MTRGIKTRMLANYTVRDYLGMRPVIDKSPPYQREGNVWKQEVSAQLIDSIINGLDMPKLYFEPAPRGQRNSDGLLNRFAVIDGKQRLLAIESFADDDLELNEDAILFENEAIDIAGRRLSDLRSSQPSLVQRFLDYSLPVVVVETDDGDLILEMFQRLNNSSALNAAEKRNAIPGATRDASNELSEHPLLVERSPIRGARYKFRELGSKFLLIEHQMLINGKLLDTKAQTLYKFFLATNSQPQEIADDTISMYRDRATETLGRMYRVFDDRDPLLRSIGTLVVYYLVARSHDLWLEVDRKNLEEFEALRRRASQMNETDESYRDAKFVRLREYNALVQSTNDGQALSRRSTILAAYLKGELASLGEGTPSDGDDQDSEE